MIFEKLTESELLKLATKLANECITPQVFCLYGDLGAGKSTFSRQFIRTLMSDPNYIIPSPTFTLVQEYESLKGTIYHFDLYRLTSLDDLIELNFDEALKSGICLIEWPMSVIKNATNIYIKDVGNNLRTIEII